MLLIIYHIFVEYLRDAKDWNLKDEQMLFLQRVYNLGTDKYLNNCIY